MAVNVNCETCIHKPVCMFNSEIKDFQEKLDSVCAEIPLNLLYKIDFTCRYRKDIDNDN